MSSERLKALNESRAEISDKLPGIEREPAYAPTPIGRDIDEAEAINRTRAQQSVFQIYRIICSPKSLRPINVRTSLMSGQSGAG